MPWAWILIGLGAVMIVTRLHVVVQPREGIEFYRGFFATDTRVRLLGIFYLVLTALLLLGSAEVGAGLQGFLAALALLTLGLAGWTIVRPGGFADFVNAIYDFLEGSAGANIARGLAMSGVLVGAWLVWMGIRAL